MPYGGDRDYFFIFDRGNGSAQGYVEGENQPAHTVCPVTVGSGAPVGAGYAVP